MAEIINLDQDHLEVVRGAPKDSIVTCTRTSAPDVYVRAIGPKDTVDLHQGDSTPFAKMSRLRFHLFRTNAGADPFSANIDISAVASDPKAPLDLMAISKITRKPSKRKRVAAKKKRT
ncbi:MAG: hypothetical protein WAK90_01680 [Pseudolabrys sp.]